MDIDYAVNALWEGIQSKRHMPSEWVGRLSMHEAYAVQLGILQKRIAEGNAQVGWKVGLTSAAMRAQQGVSEPCFGVLLESGRLRSGAQLSFNELIAPGIENELCLTLGEPLSGPDVSFEQARQAIASVEAAIEVVEVRGDFSADIALSMADNAQQKGFVTGPATAYDAAVALDEVLVHLAFNGQQLETATGKEVMGSPVNSLVWLAGKLSEFGLSLQAGTKIMSGSFTKQYAVAQGDVVTTTFDPFGAVEVAFI